MPLSILRPLFVPRCLSSRLSAPWVVTAGSRIVLLTLSSSAHRLRHRRCRCSGRCACRAASAAACPLRVITVDSCIVLLILNGMVLAIADDAVEAPAVLCVALPLQLPLHSVTRLGGIVQLSLACS